MAKVYDDVLKRIQDAEQKKKQTEHQSASSVTNKNRSDDPVYAALDQYRKNNAANTSALSDFRSAKGGREFVNSVLYQPGAGDDIRNQGTVGTMANIGIRAPMKINHYTDAEGYSEATRKDYLDIVGNAQKWAKEAEMTGRARSGDWSVLDGLDEDSDEYEEYNRLLRLAGYDSAKNLFSTALPEEYVRESSVDPKKLKMQAASGDISKLDLPVQTYQDLMDLQREYTREDLEKDLGIVSGYIDGYVSNYADYEKAAQNLSKYFGGDWSYDTMKSKSASVPILGQDNIPWYGESLAKYDADTQVLRDMLPGQNFTYEDYAKYLESIESVKQQQDEQEAFAREQKARMEKWDAYFNSPEYVEYISQTPGTDLKNPYDSSLWNKYNAFRGAMHEDIDDTTGFKYMTDSERMKYSYLYENVGENEAKEYLGDLQNDLWSRRNDDINDRLIASINESPWNATVHTAAARTARQISPVDNALRFAKDLVTGEANPNDPLYDRARYASTVDDTVGNIIAEDTPWANVAGLNIPSLIYSGTMSRIDSALTNLLYGPYSIYAIGTNAAGDEYQEGVDNGDTAFKRYMDALAYGTFEGVSENLGIDAMFKMTGGWGKYIFNNVATEVLEETANLLMGKGYDWIFGDDAKNRIAQLEYEGYTPKDARWQYIKELGREELATAISSAFAAGSTSIPVAVNIANTNRSIGQNIRDNNAEKQILDFADTLEDLPDDVKKLVEAERAAYEYSQSAAQESSAASDTQSNAAVDEFDESTAEEATEAPAASEDAETAKQKPEKPPKSSTGRMGRIFREVMTRVDERAQAVLSDVMSSGTVRNLIDTYSQNERVQPDELMKDQLAKVVTKAAWSPETLTDEEARMLKTSNAALHALQDMTAAINENEQLSETKARLEAMGSKNGRAALDIMDSEKNATESRMRLLPEEVVPDGRTIQQYASEYGKQSDIVLNAYERYQNPGQYAQQFRAAYNYGRDGRDIGTVLKSDRTSILTENQIRTAYELGRDVRMNTAAEQRMSNPTGVTVGNTDRSAIAGMKLNQAQNASVSALSRLAKAVGFNIRVVASTANAEGKYADKNGSWDRATRTLTIDINAGRLSTESANYAMMQTAGHELTHYIKQFSDTGLYNDYQEFVLGHLSKKMGNESLDDRIRSIVEGNAKLGKTLNRDQAIDEIVADASGDALMSLTDADIREMAQKKPSLLRTIGKYFEKWIKSVKALISKGYEGQTNGNVIAKQMADVADELGRKWAALLKNAQKNAMEADAGEQGRVPETNGDVQFSARDVDNYDDNDYNTEGMRWVRDEYVLSMRERAMFVEALSEISHRGYRAFARTSNGGYVVPVERAIVFTNGNYKNPAITSVIRLNVSDPAVTIAEIRKGLNDDQRTGSFHEDEAWTIVSAVLRDGSAEVFSRRIRGKDYWIDHRRSGEDSRESVEESGEWRGVYQDNENVSFSLREPVEQTRNLIAVHNITEEKLKKALALGGFPMPSIAIAKRDIGHQNFGSISLVFGRDTIDPKSNKKNKVYSADAWTPTFPQVEYEVDSNVDARVYNKLSNLKRAVDPYFSDDLSRVMYGVEDQMNRNGGEEGLVRRALDNYGMKAAYLEDNGEHITPVTRTEVQQSAFSEKQIEKYTQIADLVGADNIRKMPVNDIYIQYGDAINDIYPGASASTIRFRRILENVYKYISAQNSAPETKTVTDTAATRSIIDEAIDPDAYERWVRNLYSGIESASGVYNGKEIFTPSGNLRSFASTHYPATVEGIAKAMYDAHGGNVKNISANHDVKSLRAVTSKTFKSIEEMHKNEGRLKARTQEEADALTAALDTRLNELVNQVLDTKPKSNDTYDFLMAQDNIVSILEEAAAKKYSAETIKAAYAQYGYNISDSVAQAFSELLDDVSAMPVNIFEAKPERAVYFDEVKFAVVPDTIDDGLRQSLEGVVDDVRMYPDGDDAARLEVLNSRPDVQFSVRDGVEFIEHKYYSRFIDRLEDQKAGGYIKVGRILGEGVLHEVGLPEADLYFDISKINKALYEDHSDHIDLDVLKQIPQILRDPVVIAQADVADTVNVFGDVVAGNSPVMIGIVITKDRSGRNVINKVRTIHARRDFIKKITDENVLYLHTNKKRTRDWFQARGNVVPLGGTKFGFIRSIARNAPDVNNQIRDPYQLSDREILANTMESAARNKDELDILQRYKARVAEYGEKQKQLEEINNGIVRMKNEGASRDEILKEQNRAQILSNQIDRLDKQLAKRERTTAIRNIAKLERERVRTEQQKNLRRREVVQLTERLDREKTRYAETKAKYEQKLTEQKQKVKDVRAEKNESFARAKYLGEVEKSAEKLRTLLTMPTNKEHVPEFLRAPLGDFIEALDFRSKKMLEGNGETKRDQKINDAMDRLHAALVNVRKQQLDGESFIGYIDLPDGFVDEFNTLRMQINTTLENSDNKFGSPVYEMKSEQLHELAKAFRILHASIGNMNRLIANAKYESARMASEHSMTDMDRMKPNADNNSLINAAKDFIDWKNTVPIYAFKRFGRGGVAIFESLMNGWDKLANNSDDVIKFTEKTYTAKEVREWERDVRTVRLSGDRTVRMTTAQLMSMYCLARREQAARHLLGGGMRIGDIDSKGKTIRQAKDYTLTQADIDSMRSMLTARQRTVADALQKYMATQGAKWGNYVSMRRFGYNMFTEEQYFPIKVDRNNITEVDTQAEENSLYRLLNMSATKGLVQNANNAIEVDSIFDVFTSHMADMAKYNALGLEILDAIKWINYVEKSDNRDGSHDTRSVRKSMEKAYGKEARAYVMDFLQNLNGVTEGGREDKLVGKWISNYKVAAVANNLRVAFLQISSMPRAAYVINPKYLAAGLVKWNAGLGKNTAKAQENVGIAKWKSMGFYDTNISRNLREMIKHDESMLDKTRTAGMKLAEWGDAWTMGVLYGAVESELADKGIREGHADFKRQMNNRMREIIYKTQVVDSTMTRSHLMRHGGIMKLFTSFMSEPTLTINLLNDAIYDARMKVRSGEKNWFPGVLKQTARAFGATAMALAPATLIGALMAGFRDDDEFEDFYEKFIEALLGDYSNAESFVDYWSAFWGSEIGDNANLFSNIPIVKNLIESARGSTMEDMVTKWAETLSSGISTLRNAVKKDGDIADYYRGVYQILNGLSQMSGVAASGALRDAVAMYNTFVAEPAKWKRIQTYSNTESEAASAIFAAENAGDTERAERYRQRMDLYSMDEEKFNAAMANLAKEAYIAGEIDQATAERVMSESGKSNRNVDKAMNAADYEIDTGLKHSEMKDDFVDGEITEAQAKEYLKKYDGLRDREIDERLGQWKYEKDTGLVYSGMKDDFLDDVITKDQAIGYLTKYCGAERGDAEETVMKWQYEKDTGLVYSELKLDYEDGVISESQLRSALAKYGGKDPEKVEETVSNYDYQIATGRTTTAPKYWRIAYAFDTGKDADTLINQAFNDIMYGGDKKKTWKQARSQIASSLASYYKKDYLAIKGTAQGAQMLERILTLYEKIGYSRSYQRKYIDEKWTDD